MSDIIDQANETADLFLRAALRNRQHGDKTPTSGTGLCFNCGAPTDHRWCDAECRDEWAADQKVK